jgi:hypothetical protein
MKGLKSMVSALIFCTAYEEIGQLFRMKNKSRAECRRMMPSKINNCTRSI